MRRYNIYHRKDGRFEGRISRGKKRNERRRFQHLNFYGLFFAVILFYNFPFKFPYRCHIRTSYSSLYYSRQAFFLIGFME